MGNVLRLKGLANKELIQASRKCSLPLFLGIPLATGSVGKICQLRCRYCFVEPKMPTGKILTPNDHVRIISQFYRIGGRYIKTAHEGEPLLDPNFVPLVNYATFLGLYWTSFSNLVGMTPELASHLYLRKVSLIGKLNSLNPDIQEALTGNHVDFAKEKWTEHEGFLIPIGLKQVIDAGFNKTFREPFTDDSEKRTRLGVDIVVTKLNLKGIPDVVEFCLLNDIYPDIETLEISGEAKKDLSALQITPEDSKWLSDRLLSILGKEFLEEHKALTTDFCPLFQVGIVYNADGTLRYCYVVPLESKLTLANDLTIDIYRKLLRLKTERREQVLSSMGKQEGVLAPCPNGIFAPL